MKDIQLSFDELKDIMSKHNIDIFKYSCSELIKLGSSEHTTGNLEFMKKAIEESPYNIMYDDTFDYGMYYELISKLEYIPKTNAESENQIKENFLRDKERILYILERSKNNEIFIKPIHLLEGIRFYFKDSYMYEKGSLVDEKERDISSVISNIRNVFDEALLLPEADYLKLQEMYHPEENNYYCHRTGLPGLEDKIFKQGLKVSTQGSGERLIVKNARKVDCLIAIAGYKNFYAGNGQGDTRIILEIPKNCDRPIGSNEMDGKNTYILPTYVMGALSDSELRYDEYYRPIGNTHLHINYHQDKENYKYLFEDGYSINDPSPILNSDYGIESDMGISK